MGSFHSHQEYSSTPIQHIILYYIVQIQENLPKRKSTFASTVTSQLSLGPDLSPALRNVLTISLDLAHYALYFFPREFPRTYFPLDGFFYSANTTFETIPLRFFTSIITQLAIFQRYILLGPQPTKILSMCAQTLT